MLSKRLRTTQEPAVIPLGATDSKRRLTRGSRPQTVGPDFPGRFPIVRVQHRKMGIPGRPALYAESKRMILRKSEVCCRSFVDKGQSARGVGVPRVRGYHVQGGP